MKENSGISDQKPFDFWEKKLASLSPRKLSFRSAWPTPHPSSDLHVIVISILSEAVLREHCSLYIIQAIYHLYVGRKLICKVHCHSSLVPKSPTKKIVHYASCVSVNVGVDILHFSCYSLKRQLPDTYWNMVEDHLSADSSSLISCIHLKLGPLWYFITFCVIFKAGTSHSVLAHTTFLMRTAPDTRPLAGRQCFNC
jgi:hypothetical protein